ncbi:carbohydrate binding domain-containing protein [Winogradskyella maritima]|uniref:Carbohydrate binding domain-containing protein n=1 Tax=Winogradskyella maritima TaxID=1517766 RepID=A0ABV8AE50_9FLAO|nr:carbohydrate binding domain-containing protein [Winogradskyella maritima]
MKSLRFILSLFILLMMVGCTGEDRATDFIDNVAAPSELSIAVIATQDNSGLVTLTPAGVGATEFKLNLGEGSEEVITLAPGESFDNVYEEGSYTLTLTGIGINGLTTEYTQQLVVSFQAPQNLMVSIENDTGISKQVNVTANADFAMSYTVDFGDGTDPVISNIGETINYLYAEAGTYTITVTAVGAAIETTVYTEEFVVTEILQPLTAAPTPPERSPEDVISIYSNAYTPITVNELPTPWSNTGFEEIQVDGDDIIKYFDLAFTGIVTDYGNPTDLTAMEFVHFDYWTADATTLSFKIVNTAVDPVQEDIESAGDIVQGEWVSVEIPLDDFNMDRSQVTQLLFDTLGNISTIYIDNLYFYKTPETNTSNFDDGLLQNGDFESGSVAWLIGVDDNNLAPVTTDGDNSYYSVDVASAGNAFDVNISQKTVIVQGNTYTLSFEAWSDVDRSIVVGIGLSGPPWSAAVVSQAISTTPTTYSVTLTASDFGAPDARVIFDMGAETGQVNIDNVSLFEGNGNLLSNGTFESGSTPWIVGVDDNSPAPVVSDGSNMYYSVDVAVAGNAFDVNVSQKLEIIADETYILTFDAWSEGDRSIIAGIGLSGPPFSASVEEVNITSTRTTYMVTLTATGFGAPDARVLFDSGAQTGLVNIDNVSLSRL